MKVWVYFAVFTMALANRIMSQSEYSKLQENVVLPNKNIVLHCVIFVFMMFLFIYPPDFVTGVGLTLENFASAYLGNADPDIVPYQCKRIVINRAFLGCVPFLFSLYLFLANEYAEVFSLHPTRFIHYAANSSLILLTASFIYWLYHHMTDFKHLSALKTLEKYDKCLRTLFIQIAGEVVQMETYRYTISNSSRLVITRNWLLYYTKFTFVVLKADDVTFHIIGSEEILNPLYPDGMMQLLKMKITVPNTLGKDIYFKIGHMALRDLRMIGRMIHIENGVQLKMSTIDYFAEAFRREAEKNAPFEVENTDDLEPCLACSDAISNMKIVRHCGGERVEGEEPCGVCHCRPMWCVSCMAKVFAAKQNQENQESWLSGKAPCPTCRAVFCILDVSLIPPRSLPT